MPDQINLNSYLLLAFGATVTFLVGLWMRSSGVKNKRIDDLEKDVNALKLQVAISDTKITPLWAKVQKQMSDEIHHPDAANKETDDLIDKLENLEVTPTETARLKVLLHERANSTDPKVTARERSIAKIMPVIMDLVLEEAESDMEAAEVEQVASVPIQKLKEKAEE